MSAANAAPPWSEFNAAEPLRPAQHLVESACDISVEVRGGIAEVELSQRITNTGPAALAATTELELPENAQLIGVSLQRGKGKAEAAIPVTAWKGTERVQSEKVLGADPVIVTALQPLDNGRPRYRAVIQPLAPDADFTLATRWTAAVEIRDGALRVLVPGRGDGASKCKGLVDVKPGPGARVERIRLDGNDLGIRSTATFDHGAADSRLVAVLAFAKPLVWTQSMPLGSGVHAQAVTVLTPAVRAANARRALFVIDGSRSMELVGRHNVQRLVREIGSALPQKSEIEAVIFDRKPTRVLGAWKQATGDTLTTIQEAVRKRTATNGSDTAAALSYARSLFGDARGQTLVVLITDGVMGDIAPDALTKALGGSAGDLDLHAIALAPGRMTAPDAAALKAPVNYFGGSYVEVPTKDIDTALASIDSWLRPAWQELALTGTSTIAVPEQLRAGTGVVLFDVVKKLPALGLTGASDTTKIKVKAGKGPAAPLAHLALAAPGEFDETTRAKLRERHASVDDQHAFVVLSSSGNVAANRRAMIAGGGPYTRMIDVDDPPFPADVRIGQPVVIGGSAMDRQTVTVLLRQYLQPAAFVCYQRALGLDGNLSGTAQFKLEIGRGELTRAHVIGIGNAAFDACLLDAAYAVTPPLPNPDFNTDDRTIVNYPLTFSVRESKPFVVAGDADSSSPIDIDAIQGGPPIAKKKGHVEAGDTSTPLGGLRVPTTK